MKAGQAAHRPGSDWSGRGGSESRPCPGFNICLSPAVLRYRLSAIWKIALQITLRSDGTALAQARDACAISSSSL